MMYLLKKKVEEIRKPYKICIEMQDIECRNGNGEYRNICE